MPADEVEFEHGVARHASGKEATFAQLAARAERLPVPGGVQLKDLSEYKLIGGEGRLRVDSVPKILGTTRFTIDVSVPGMLTAVVLHPPRFGAAVASVDDQAALAGAEQRGVPAARGRSARKVGEHRITRVQRMSASEAAGIDKEQVEVHVTFARGSFGLHSRSKRDLTAEAVQIARALDWKHPIKVQSLLEEDFKSGRSARWPYTAYGPRRTQTVD